MKFRQAAHEATMMALDRDPSVFLIGVGVIVHPAAHWNGEIGTPKRFKRRVIEGPLSEDALTGISIGAATLGMKPILIHHRMDFVLLTVNQIFTHAAKWSPMFGHQQSVPMVVMVSVGRALGNAAQHTQSMHAMFAHVPGLKTVVPSSPKDAKGLLLAALEDGGPVVYIQHRWLDQDEGVVPSGYYRTPIGKAEVVRSGSDVTIAAVGTGVADALKAAEALEKAGISIEVVDVRTIRPLDHETIAHSVMKTGRLVAVDSDWGPCGVAGEIIAGATERVFSHFKRPPVRVVWPETCLPFSQNLEHAFYPGAKEIQEAAAALCDHACEKDGVQNTVKHLEGPF